MTSQPRTPEPGGKETTLAEAFVRLADTLVADYDVIDLLHELAADCVELLDVDAAGLLLADQRGGLRVAAASTEQTHMVELFQLQADEGPCMDCFRSSAPVHAPDLGAADERWPRFAAHARHEGFHGVHALPLRLREQTIGALNLFTTAPRAISPTDLRIGQSLADVATISVLQTRSLHDQALVTEQLQAALTSRIIIEQAKGILAERAGIDLAEAFTSLRSHARRNNERLSDLARGVVDGTLDTSPLLQAPLPPS